MANDPQVKLVLTADASQLSSEIAKLQRQFGALGGSGGAGSAFKEATAQAETFQQSLKGMIGRFSAIWAGFKAIQGTAQGMTFGIEFNAQMEEAKLGIATLITSQAKLKDSTGRVLQGEEALGAAVAISTTEMQKLRVASLQTKATTQELVGAYQDAMGAGLQAGLRLDQIRDLTVRTVQAAGTMQVPMNQLNQEIRSILSGTIDRNSRVARVLGITNEDINRWKAAGTLYEELQKRMSAFATAGKESMNNWRTLLSNAVEASQMLVGTAVKEPMDRIRDTFAQVLSSMMDTTTGMVGPTMAPVMTMLHDIAGIIADTFNAVIRGTVDLLKNMGAWWERNREAIQGFIAGFKTFMSDALTFAGTIAGALFNFFGWLMGVVNAMPAALNAATVALVAFFGVMAMGAGAQLPMMVALVGKLTTAFEVLKVTFLSGMQSFQNVMTTITASNPILLTVAAVAALGSAMWYLGTASERAASAETERMRASMEYAQKLPDFVTTMGELETKLKDSKIPLDEWNEAAGAKVRMVRELQTLIPGFLKGLSDEAIVQTEVKGRILEVVTARRQDLEMQRAIMLQQLDAAKRAVAQAEASKIAMANTTGGLLFSWIYGSGNVAGANKQLEETTKRIKDIDAALKSLGGIESGEKARQLQIQTQKAAEDAKKAEERRAANAAMRLLVQKSELDAMPKVTEEQRKQYEIAKSDFELEQERERIRKSKADVSIKNAAQLAVAAAGARERENIEESSAARIAAIQQKWEDFKEKQEGDTLERRIELLRIQARKLQDERKKAGLAEISDEEMQQALRERIARETQKFRDGEVAALKEYVNKKEQASGHKFSLADEIATLDEFSTKARFSAEAVAQLRGELQTLQEQQGNGWAGFMQGLTEYANQFANTYDMMKNMALSTMNSIQSATTNALAAMLQGQITFKEMLKQIWKGILQAIAQAVAGMIVNWVLANTFGAFFTNMQRKQSEERKQASLEAGAAAAWEAYGSIPYIGAALAMAQIAMMVASVVGVGAASAASSGSTPGAGGPGGESGAPAKVMGVGGVLDRPTYALMGEAGRELVAPESSFLDWVTSVGNPAMEKAAMANGINTAPLVVSGNMFLTGEEETRQIFADYTHSALRDRDRRKG